MHCSKANAYLIWHLALLANVLMGHKWIISALWKFSMVCFKRKRKKSLCLVWAPIVLSARVILSLSPAVLISDYSHFMFPCVLCSGTARCLTDAARRMFPTHRARGTFQVLSCIGLNVNRNFLTLHRSCDLVQKICPNLCWRWVLITSVKEKRVARWNLPES